MKHLKGTSGNLSKIFKTTNVCHLKFRFNYCLRYSFLISPALSKRISGCHLLLHLTSIETLALVVRELEDHIRHQDQVIAHLPKITT